MRSFMVSGVAAAICFDIEGTTTKRTRATETAAAPAHTAILASPPQESCTRRYRWGATGRRVSTTPGSSTISRAVVPSRPSRTGAASCGSSARITRSAGQLATSPPSGAEMMTPQSMTAMVTDRDRAVMPS